MKILYRFILSIIFIFFSLYSLAYFMKAPHIGLDHSLEMINSNNQVFYASNNDHYGSYVSLDEVSPDFLNAIIAIEDKNFYSHSGFDFLGILRAIITNLTHQSLSQGASTISQQYVKNLFLSNEKTWERKLKEAWLTIRVEVHHSKEAILEGYINTVYFGDGVYGIENAADHYFNKNAADLNLLESSLLAGMINGPELYSPYRNYDLTKERQQFVLQAMKENDFITTQQYKQVKNKDTSLFSYENQEIVSTLGYFRQLVYQELEALGLSDYDGSLKIYTTLDQSLQNKITTSMSQTMSDEIQASSIVMEPNSGAVRVLIGGKNYVDSQFNRATDSYRQMASTIKPILYYDALVNGFHPLSKFISEKTTFYLDNNQSYTPTNYNNKYPNKEITMLRAIASSDNIYAVKTHLFLDPKTLTTRLSDFGYQDLEANASLALGTKETSPLQLCALYNCIASQGIYYDPYCIEKITNEKGEILYQKTIQGEKKLDETYCLILSQLLTATFKSELDGTMSMYQVNNTYSAKTGTSDWDSWLVAYHPKLTFTMWAGYDDNQYLDYPEQSQCRQVFYEVFKDEKKVDWYHPNQEIVQIPIDLENEKMSRNGEIFWFYQSTYKRRI